MEAMKIGAEQLCALLNEEETGYVEQHLMMLESNWQGFLGVHSQISSNLLAAMDKSSQFNALYTNLRNGCRISHSSRASRIEGIRKEVDTNALLREQLNSLAVELCFNAPPAQAHATRTTANEVNQRWNHLYSTINERQQRLEKGDWIDKTKSTLDCLNTSPSSDLKQIEIELCKFRVIYNDIQAHLASYEAIDTAGQQMLQIQPESAPITQPMLEMIAEKWIDLNSQAEHINQTLEAAKVNASSRGSELDKWSTWLKDVLNELKSNRPLGGLPETAYSQLDDFSILKADVEQKKLLEQELQRITQSEDGPSVNLQEQYDKINNNWQLVQVKIGEREQRLNEALKDAINMQNGMEEIGDWLTESERVLSTAPAISRTLDSINNQIAQHAAFNTEVNAKKEKLKELQNKGVRIQLSCEKKDAIPMKNKLVSLKHRMDKVHTRTAERTRQLENAQTDTQMFEEAKNELLQWISAKRVRDMLNEHKNFHEQIERRKSTFDMLCTKGKSLEDHAPPSEKKTKRKEVEALQQNWENSAKTA
uniref:Dystrophin n=1 Tax=Ditylenchus dipsaci TaxID=166011 RepID=A0A915ENC3_9BILA